MAAAGRNRLVIANCPEDLVDYLPAPGSLSQQNERFAAVDRKCLQSAAALLRSRRHGCNPRLFASYLRHARGAIWCRKMVVARRMLLKSLDVGVSLPQLVLLFVTLLPTPILDLKRRLYSGGGG